MESVLEQPLADLPASRKLDHTSLHLLPCGIHHDGKANIPGFFFLVDGQYPSSAAEPSSATQISSADKSLQVSSTSPDTTETATENGDTIKSTSAAASEASSTLTTKVPVAPETSFRGRTLKGTVIQVPEGYMGTVYKSYEAPKQHDSHSDKGSRGDEMDMDEDGEYEAMLRSMQEERKVLRTEAQFKEFMMWGHDEQPSLRTEKVVRAMQWFDIAKILHEPLC
ncbi:ribonuclease H2, subunit C [Dissophora ornata]|nr:hypothetical protein BGZ58_006922 [Dissophora ornata]KAI8601646.1 ribonuclease H2, subunit C [Dissophora ornata]